MQAFIKILHFACKIKKMLLSLQYPYSGFEKIPCGQLVKSSLVFVLVEGGCCGRPHYCRQAGAASCGGGRAVVSVSAGSAQF